MTQIALILSSNEILVKSAGSIKLPHLKEFGISSSSPGRLFLFASRCNFKYSPTVKLAMSRFQDFIWAKEFFLMGMFKCFSLPLYLYSTTIGFLLHLVPLT